MHRPRLSLLFFLIASVTIVGCASKPPAPAASQDPESSSVQAEANGLAPSGDPRFQRIDFALLFGNKEAIVSWSFVIIDAKQKTAVRTIKGDGSELPDKISWDGNADAGTPAAEGSYVANLAVEYGATYNVGLASSKQFVLVKTPPSASFAPNPAQFAYSASGVPAPISIAISTKAGLAKIAAWNLDVFDAAGDLIKSFEGSSPSGRLEWDGKTESGGYVETAKSYPAVLTASDEYGNKGVFKGAFSVAAIAGAQASSISPRRGGFSPTSESVKNNLDLLLAIGSKASALSWRVDVLSVEKGSAKTVRSFSGGAADIPEYLRWDGKDDAGNLAPQGSYYATLSVDYGKAYKPTTVKSKNFSLVTTPPAGSITVDPPTISPNEIGPKKPVNFTVQAKSAFAQIASWILAVYDPSNVSIVVFNGNWPNNKVAWDGKTVEGGRLIPGSQYRVAAKVQDEYGNIGDLQGNLIIEGLFAATEPSSIVARAAGFAPTGDGSNPTMDFAISIGDAAAAKAWKVDFIQDDMVERSISGTGAKLPAALSWDGKASGGAYAPEGRYTAMLSVDYGTAYAPVSVESQSFVLDLTPPSGEIRLSTDLFSPDGDGENDALGIELSGASSLARIASWSLSVNDPGNSPFISWKGSWPAAPLTWDGKGRSGDLVESASDYALVLKLRDEFGNVGIAKANLATDILVMKVGDGYRIRVSSIVFKGFTADYLNVPDDRAARNVTTLGLLASKLSRFPDYRIKLEGHAVMINWDDPKKGKIEQDEILIPLSKARAEAIKDALAERGVSADRLVTEGVGALDPIVPDSDYPNRWKNRRVEFYILK